MIQSAKGSVRALVHIAKQKNIEHVVFSPGSRNAPLVIGFGNNPNFKCIVVPDERSAGFVALGLALATNKPVLMCCTSGTASVNYYPAIAEAFYQKVPIVAITADRPSEWIDQGDGQTIRQSGVFASHVVYQTDLYKDSDDLDADAFHSNQRNINEALNEAWRQQGPVHINMPFEEPLYGTFDGNSESFLDINLAPEKHQSTENWQPFVEKWYSAQRKLILVGQCRPHNNLSDLLEKLSADNSLLIMSESTANIHLSHDVKGIDRLINTLSSSELNDFNPEIILTFGDAIVSKKIKALLRNNPTGEHWHVAPTLPHPDTYQKLTASIAAHPHDFLSFLLERKLNNHGAFGLQWRNKNELRLKFHQEYVSRTPFSDLKFFDILLNNLPQNIILHLANSSVIRYAQLFDSGREVPHYSNRGTAGIDGSTSTALGFALATNKQVYVVSGDISFFYDSNAFFNNHVPHNLKVIVVNNQGGNIFTIIPGPDSTGHSEQFFETPQQASIALLSQTFGLGYLFADDENTLQAQLKILNAADKATVLEVKTPGHLNGVLLNNYFKFLKDAAV